MKTETNRAAGEGSGQLRPQERILFSVWSSLQSVTCAPGSQLA